MKKQIFAITLVIAYSFVAFRPPEGMTKIPSDVQFEVQASVESVKEFVRPLSEVITSEITTVTD